jgi:hypothetical protein
MKRHGVCADRVRVVGLDDNNKGSVPFLDF